MAKRVNDTNEEKKNKAGEESTAKLVTKESLCAVFGVFALVAFLIICTGQWIFGDVGIAVQSFLTGVFGYYAYPVLLLALYLSVAGIFGKGLIKNKFASVCIALTVLCAGLLLHAALTYSWDLNGYLAACYKAGATFPNATVTGVVGGVLVYLLTSVMSKVGAIVIFSVATLVFAYLSYVALNKGVKTTVKSIDNKKEKTTEQPQTAEIPLTIPTIKQNAQSSVKEEVAPTSPQVMSQAPATQQPAYGYDTVSMPQRPAFSLSNEEVPQPQNGNAFSPFATPQGNTPAQHGNDYERTREFLFGITPQEAYQKNLIFDPNEREKRRSSSVSSSALPDGYTPSYTNAYQSSLNTQTERPIKIVSDQTTETPYQALVEPVREEGLTPLAPIETHRFETPAATPHLIEETLDEPVEELPVRESLRDYENTSGEPSRHNYMDLFSSENPNVFGDSAEDRALARDTFGGDRDTARRELFEEPLRGYQAEEEDEPTRGRDALDIFDEEEDDPYSLRDTYEEPARGRLDFIDEPAPLPERGRFEETERGRFEEIEEEKEEPVVPPVLAKPTPPPLPPKPRVIRPYVRMPIDDFDCRDVEPSQNPEQVEETKRNIIATLENFKVTGATIASVTFGPTVTRYNVAIPGYISPKKVFSLDDPLALCLHSPEVSISPNYENGVVSIEVPNEQRQFVNLGSMLTGDTYVNASPSSLMFTMGKDVGNRKIYGDISKMIHMLVAGSSGSGKSVFLGSLIISLIHKYSPEELRLILIDPKKTEFVIYNDLPHLMINEIITDAHKAVQSLNWAIGEMNRRYTLFEQMSRTGTYVVNLDQYNSHVEKTEKLPKIVIIIDELADLMLAAKKEVEDRIQNLTQKARAAGIHLVVATQRPSTDVITGVIKSNLSTRIAFSVATDVDSRVILDQTGAQKLLGKGDFLYVMQGVKTPIRVQSAFISAEDSQRVVNFIKANNEAYYDENATAFINKAHTGSDGSGGFDEDGEVEPVYIEALRFAILSESASISLIQRKCSVGYNKAGRIVDWMEKMGYISNFDGAKARKVLITKEEFESKYGPL